MKGLIISFLIAALICLAAGQPSEPAPVAPPMAPPTASPVQAPVDPPAASPVEAPALPPVAAPVLAPEAAPAAEPVAPPAAPTPVSAPSGGAAPSATPVAAPVAAPVAVPVAAPLSSPVAAPIASSPVSSSSCYANGCSYFEAVNATFISFGGNLGAAYSPRCVVVLPGTELTFSGDFNAHPFVDGLVVGSIAYPTSTPVVNLDRYLRVYQNPGVYPFYSNSNYQQGMKGAVYVGSACSATPRAPPVPPAAAPPTPTSEVPTSTLYSCEVNGCNARNTRQFGAPRSSEPAPRAIEFGDARGTRYSLPCLYIPVGDSVTISGDFTKYPLQTGIADGNGNTPNNDLALAARVKDLVGKTNITISDLPAGVYPYYSPPYTSLGMYGALFVGVCGSASSIVAPVFAAVVAAFATILTARI